MLPVLAGVVLGAPKAPCLLSTSPWGTFRTALDAWLGHFAERSVLPGFVRGVGSHQPARATRYVPRRSTLRQFATFG